MGATRQGIGREELLALRFIADNAPISARDVADHLARTSGKARTTVLTMVERLRRKGYLTRRKSDGVYRYAPRLPKSDVLRRLVGDFVRQSLDGSLLPFMAYLTRDADLTDDELTELERLVTDLKQRRCEDAE